MTQTDPVLLQVAIATNRIEALRLPPPTPGVATLVSWQGHGNRPVPADCLRNDVAVVRCDTPGLSANRNNAIAACSAPLVLLADDDLLYTPPQLSAVIEAFASRPDVDLAVFKVAFPRHKHYPPAECDLLDPLPKGFSVTSMEIAFRNPLPAWLRFNPFLGLGARDIIPGQSLGCGEEELFLFRAVKGGLRCRFIPVEICTHPQLTTGQKTPSPEVLRGMGALIRIMWPSSWPWRIPLKALRVSRDSKKLPSGQSIPATAALRHLVAGCRLAPLLKD